MSDIEIDDSDNDMVGEDESFEYESNEEELFLEENTVDASGSSMNNKEPAFQALTSDDIVTEQREAIERVMDLTQVPSHMARQLLQEMRWNHEALAELYFEDPDRLMAKAGLQVNGEAVDSVILQTSASNGHKSGAEGGAASQDLTVGQASVTCQVCMDEFSGEEAGRSMTALLQCGHMFCNDCWRRHLQFQIDDQGQAARISCPGEAVVEGRKIGKCNIIVDERVVERLLEGGADRRLLAKYKKRLIEEYVNNNASIKWCPATDCTNAVRINDNFDPNSFATQVHCGAAHAFCFSCLDEPHSPAECCYVKLWRKKCMDDSETCNWLQANTKDCPKCRVAINKDGGCNHMHCRQCDYHFCWVCLGPFEHTTYQHTCNKFVHDDNKVTKSRAALVRYMHHYERYMAHQKSREFESKVREGSLAKMEQMQAQGNKTYMEVQFLKQATAQLIEARQILQWTYVIGYYEPRWLVRNIFENNQSELENATERLSNMIESEEIIKWCEENERVLMINQTNMVRTRLNHLFVALEEWKATHQDTDQDNEEAAGAGGDEAASAHKEVKEAEDEEMAANKHRKVSAQQNHGRAGGAGGGGPANGARRGRGR
mmetsp:Transcript_49385/g.116377  ORF Transcript_49385/g.116377 Transcript_49385/m.116377 type:complete len:602 (+) Transcript_49385:258-2063(+)